MTISKYNHLYEAKELNKSILINYLNGKMIVFKDDANVQVKDLLTGKNFDSNINDYLCNNGYLVDKNIDEIKEVKKIQKDIYENKDVLSLVFILTENCNLRCIYCCEQHGKKRMSFVLQEQIVKFVEENINKYKCLKVEWFGGEPLLCMDIIEYLSKKFIEICNKNHIRYFAVTSTNGYLLNAQNLKKLKNLHVYVYQITVDGLKKTHDAQRMKVDGTGSWDIIINNLKDIRDNFKSNLISLIIRTNVTYPIYQSIDEYMDFLLNEFGDDKRFNFLWRIAEDWGNIEDDTRNILCGISEYANVMKKAGEKGLRNRYLSGTLKPGERACEATKKNSLILFPTGIIGKCERDVCPEKSHIGTIRELLKDPEKYLNTTLSKGQETSEICKSCSKFTICLGKACPFITDIQCGYEMKDIDFLLDCIIKCDDSCKVISRFKKENCYE